MLSVILYARNDNHGYNYSKRITLSINCISELLTHPNDEILFIDYNTNDDYPSILESIQDTLTDKAKKVLKGYRIRESIHNEIKNDSPLSVIEPIARNAAIRRSNPNNKWILSTNIDMIFVTKHPNISLSDLVFSLEDGYYCLPRFEIPENLWELNFNRCQPKQIIDFLRKNSRRLCLHTIIRRPDFLQFDNPGDFQLFLREDLFTIRGFDESMNKGWHVDSNIAKRISMIQKFNNMPEESIFSFHCNHNKQITFLHSPSSTENNWFEYVESSSIQPIVNNPNWGLNNTILETINLRGEVIQKHLDAITQQHENEDVKNFNLLIDTNAYNQLIYEHARSFTFLTDQLVTLPQKSLIFYIGVNTSVAKMLEKYSQKIGLRFTSKILLPNHRSIEAAFLNLYPILNVTVWIFDFGISEETINEIHPCSVNIDSQNLLKILEPIKQMFLKISGNKQFKKAKFIGINVKHNDFESVFRNSVDDRLNSHASGISYGYFKNPNRSIQTNITRKLLQFLRLGRRILSRIFDKIIPNQRIFFMVLKKIGGLKDVWTQFVSNIKKINSTRNKSFTDH